MHKKINKLFLKYFIAISFIFISLLSSCSFEDSLTPSEMDKLLTNAFLNYSFTNKSIYPTNNKSIYSQDSIYLDNKTNSIIQHITYYTMIFEQDKENPSFIKNGDTADIYYSYIIQSVTNTNRFNITFKPYKYIQKINSKTSTVSTLSFKIHNSLKSNTLLFNTSPNTNPSLQIYVSNNLWDLYTTK